MPTVEILPSSTIETQGTFSIGGGAGSVVAALNDASDSTYIFPTGTVATSPSATFIFPTLDGVIPDDSVVEGVALRFRYSHAVAINPANVHELIKPLTILAGKPVGSTHTFYTYTVGERFPDFKQETGIRTKTFPIRPKGAQGSHFGDLMQTPMARLYASIHTSRKTAWNTARMYSLSLIVTYNEMPAVVLTTPTGTVTISRPPFNWTYDDPEENPQAVRQVKIFEESVTLLGGFDPNTSEHVYESSIFTTSKTHTPSKSFGVNGNYVGYVRAAHFAIGSTEMWSEWDDNPFTLNVPSPVAPTVTATYQSAQNAILVVAQGSENMLTYALASFEHDPVTNPPSWTAGASTTVARTQAATAEPDGTWAISLTRTGTTGTAAVIVPQDSPTEPTYGVHVHEGNDYKASAAFRAATTARSVRVIIDWIDMDGATLSQTVGSSVSDSNAAWTTATATGTAPIDAVFAKLRLEVLSAVASEVHYVDTIMLNPNTSATWRQGGFVNEGHHMPLQRSFDGGTTWEDVESFDFFHDPIEQHMEFWDYEVPSTQQAHYQVRVETVNQDFDVVASPWSTADDATMPQFDSWWLRDLESPGELSMPLYVTHFNFDKPKPQTTHWPLGQVHPVVSHDGVKAEQLNVRAILLTKEHYDMFNMMIDSGKTLLLQDVLGRQWYVQAGDGIQYDHFTAQPLDTETTPIRHAHTVELSFQSVARPSASPVGVGQAMSHG